jgi:hypothetical protein
MTPRQATAGEAENAPIASFQLECKLVLHDMQLAGQECWCRKKETDEALRTP